MELDVPEGASITDGLAALEKAGFTAQLVPEDGGRVRCAGCQRTVPAETLDVQAIVRTEGASDPSEEAIVIGAVCGACGERGTLVLSFGPDASAQDADLLQRMRL